MAKKIAETPLMTQYAEMKKKHPDAVLLFRVGDFYETFSEDAITASEILGITLTRRANGKASSVELAGFPHHALDTYLPKLVRAGKRVAICEQLEDPKQTKTLVKRGITELITPGVNISESALASSDNNFLAAIHINRTSVGAAFLDVSTGEFLCAQGEKEDIDKLLTNIAPRELLRMHGTRQFCEENFTHRCPVYEMDDWVYTSDAAEERLMKHFGTSSLKGFGVDRMHEAVIAAGSILHYLDLTQHTEISHITSLGRIERDRFVALDRFTVRNLELVAPLSSEGMSLLDVLDHTSTPMGARRLHNWILFPLLDLEEIRRRHNSVEYFLRDPSTRQRADEILKGVGELERLVMKVGARRIGPRDTRQLHDSLQACGALRRALAGSDSPELRAIAGSMADCSDLVDTIGRTVRPDAPIQLGKSPALAEGVDPELDELRALRAHGRDALRSIQERESACSGTISRSATPTRIRCRPNGSGNRHS